jgi:hypothetical protein
MHNTKDSMSSPVSIYDGHCPETFKCVIVVVALSKLGVVKLTFLTERLAILDIKITQINLVKQNIL